MLNLQVNKDRSDLALMACKTSGQNITQEGSDLSEVALDQRAFRKLFKEHYNLLCNFLHSRTHDWDLSQEVAQRTFVKLWEKRNDISISTSPKSYLFQAARNTLIDHYRAQKVASEYAESYGDDKEKVEYQDAQVVEGLAVTEKIAWAVNQLKPKTKEIFLLSKQEGLTYEEIADYLKISKRTVEYNMKNALLQLKDLLQDKI